jgi:uncharacterized membrane protein
VPRILTVLLSALLLVYPFVVYFSLHVTEPAVIAGVLALFFVLRLWMVYRSFGKETFMQQLLPMGGAILLLLVVMVSNNVFSLRLTPVFINLGLFILFTYTLYKPPSMIERFARLVDKNLPDSAISYTRKVTGVWCVFFIFNASASFYTAAFSSMEIWMLYNGCIAYLLVALLFAIEYIVRLRVRAVSDKETPDKQKTDQR